MKINSLAKLGGVALVTGLILAGCGSKSSQSKKQEISWMTPSPIATMDTSKMTDLYSAQVANGTNEGLLRIAKDNKVNPGVAKSYSVSKDGLTWTFNLRHSKWSNGDPVTAKILSFHGNEPLIQRLRHNMHTYLPTLRTQTRSAAERWPYPSLV